MEIDDVECAHSIRRNVDLLAVDQEVAMAYELARHIAALCEACAIDDIVETGLKEDEQVVTGLTSET
ncbi:unannotated protein [freshwater metagenome]|uniref:Unannotated protein n=1 Tax=freshwater metagenome TaxID=449393 RepID=A0A6J6DTV5_9ZZZZ